MTKKFFGLVTALSLAVALLAPMPSFAAVSVTAGPSPLFTDPIKIKALSSPLDLFGFTASNDAGETLSGVSVLVSQNATTTVSGSDLANIALYKDNGDNAFNSLTDILVGSQSTVNIGSTTMVSAATSTAFSGKFFVSLQTGSSWSGTAPADSILVTFPSNGIVTSATTSPSTSATSTASVTADTTAPQLTSAVAKNTGGTDQKEAGDSIELIFSEPTNKPGVTSANINTYFSLNNSHSFLDLNGNLGAITWNEAGTILTLTLSGTTTPTSTLASVVTGDVVAVVSNSNFTDLAGNMAAGTQSISGSFAGSLPGGGGEEVRGACANGLVNGKLYKIGSEPTVYLAAACRLKPFRGAAVFHARGQKFQNIITLSSAPANVSVNLNDPVLPTAGTLVKGSDNTVWFIDKNGKRRGFVSGKHFMELGFEFKKVKQISDSDLQFMPVGSPIENNEDHPDGAMLKCGNSGTVFQVIGNSKFPFASQQAFEGRGNSFEHVLTVDCGRFKYTQGAAINP